MNGSLKAKRNNTRLPLLGEYFRSGRQKTIRISKKIKKDKESKRKINRVERTEPVKP
jgi:hypothetical protein